MAFALDATVAGISANAYLTRAAAEDLLLIRGYSEWTAATDQEKEFALVAATEDLDQNVFSGMKTYYGQRLQFPRSNQEEAITTIPLEVQRACCEQAVWILKNKAGGGQSDRQQLQAAGVTEFQAGHLREVFAKRGKGPETVLGPKALSLISGYLSRGGHIIGPQERAAYDRPFGYYGWPLS